MLARILYLLLTALAAAPAECAALEFCEDFDDARIAARRLVLNGEWKISGGVMTSANTGNDSVSFRFGAPDWRNFDLRFRLRRIALTGKDQHFGVRVRKTENDGAPTYVQFYSRGDAIGVLECVAGKTVRHEHLCSLPKGMGIGADSAWTDFRVVFSGGDAKISVNDVPVCGVRNVAPRAGWIEFYAYGVVVQIDNLNARVTQTDSAARTWTQSPNLVPNSSFETRTQDGLADYWGCPHWGLSDPYFAARFELWTECFGTDPTRAFDGQRSMRIVVPFDKVDPGSTGLCLRSVKVGTEANEDYVLSAHMKSDRPGSKVMMNGKEIAVGADWRRYSIAYRHDGKSPYQDMINIVPMLRGTYWIDAVQLEKGTTPTKYVPSIMDAVVSAQAEDGPEQKTTKRVAAPAPAAGTRPARNVVAIDRMSRMITVNGKPFFPIACVQDGPLTPESLASFAGAGFNAAAIFADPADVASARKMLDDAHRSGLMVKISFQARDLNTSGKFVNALKDHPALLAWDVFDEAFTGEWGKSHYGLIARRCAELKEIDPAHPVHINENEWGLNYLRSKSLDFPGDIVSIDYYAYPPAGDVAMTALHARHMNEIGKAASKPCWMYVLSGGYAFWASREPTPEELAGSTYLAIVNGVTGIYYWAGHPRSKSVWREMKQLATEIDWLTPVIASTASVAQAKCSSPDIQVMTRKHGGDLHVIAVNGSSEPVEGTITPGPGSIQSRKPRCRVLFEEREIQMRDGAIRDRFSGHERHIYKITQ